MALLDREPFSKEDLVQQHLSDEAVEGYIDRYPGLTREDAFAVVEEFKPLVEKATVLDFVPVLIEKRLREKRIGL